MNTGSLINNIAVYIFFMLYQDVAAIPEVPGSGPGLTVPLDFAFLLGTISWDHTAACDWAEAGRPYEANQGYFQICVTSEKLNCRDLKQTIDDPASRRYPVQSCWIAERQNDVFL